jgi:hypothetical protein
MSLTQMINWKPNLLKIDWDTNKGNFNVLFCIYITLIMKTYTYDYIFIWIGSYFTCGEIGTTNYIQFKLAYKLQLKDFNYIMYSVFWLWFYRVGMDDIASGLTMLVACKVLATNVDWFFLLREALLSVLFWHFKVFGFSGHIVGSMSFGFQFWHIFSNSRTCGLGLIMEFNSIYTLHTP